jgi:hypothetical protein
MSFDTFLRDAWAEHGDQPLVVAERLRGAHTMTKTPEQVAGLAGIVTHVFGEHLGDWQGGETALRHLAEHASARGLHAAQRAIDRAVATLRLASSHEERIDMFSASEQISVLCTAASAAAGAGNIDRAIELFDELPAVDRGSLPEGDPAYRSLAITGNNLAGALREKWQRTPAEDDAMLRAAHASRTYWEIAGTWMHVERAEYTLAKCLLALERPDDALVHARACLAVCLANGAPPFELFFAHEALALALLAQGDRTAFEISRDAARAAHAAIDESERSWCEGALAELSAAGD